ncbi:GNAT family N-acetyltransferase [Kitasatospora sp. NPDC005751]|uniref:GNAT family N-acetyltransferase n=1 Tax=Kitasatospora sp. NPDC005751 TaxID=3157064 RepID=UPI003406DBA6
MSHVANIMISVEFTDRPAVEALSQWLRTSAPRRGYEPGAVGWVGSLNETTGSDTRWGGGTYPECEVFAGALNHADLAGLVAHVERVPWVHPELVQLFVMDQEQSYFRVWMFHGPRLRQIAPEGREDDVYPDGGPSDIHTRFALADDAEFLRDLVVAAVNWAPGRDVSREAVLSDPRNAHYVDGWPGRGDLGIVALSTGEATGWQPLPVGAAWLRHLPAEDPGYGFVDPAVPELSIGITAAQRGRGIGTLLIRRLLRTAAEAGVERVSLSVERDNPALRLYEREGFRVHDPREGEDALTMVTRLRRDS